MAVHRRAGALGDLLDRGRGPAPAYRSDAVLASAEHPNFDPVAFAASSDALYICAPAQTQDQLAPLVVALLEADPRRRPRAAGRCRPGGLRPRRGGQHRPLPSFPALAAEGGGQGLVTLACLQDLSQARVRWGEAAEGFFTLFGTKVILPGVADHRTLQLISALAGEERVIVPSVTRSNFWVDLVSGSTPTSTRSKTITWRARLPVDAVARGRPGHGLLIESSEISYLRLLPWWEHPIWSKFGGNAPQASFWSEMQPLSPE